MLNATWLALYTTPRLTWEELVKKKAALFPNLPFLKMMPGFPTLSLYHLSHQGSPNQPSLSR